MNANLGPHNGTDPWVATPEPGWPDLAASQRAEALALTWPARLRQGVFGAALLAFLTAAVSYSAADGVLDWRIGISLTLGGAFLAAYALLETQRFTRAWLAPIGYIAIALTLTNVMACMTEQVRGALEHGRAAADPALIFFMLVVGSLWALRIHLSPGGFTLSAILTFGILWAPWLVLSQAPVGFVLAGLACVGAGAQLRWMAAERAYAVYRRTVVLPRLSRSSIQASVLRQLSRYAAAADSDETADTGGPAPAPASTAQDAGLQGSLGGLAEALGASKAPAPGVEQPEDEPRKAGLSA